MEKKATDWGEVTRYGLGGFASAVPARFLAPVVTVAVNVVLAARFAVGVNVSVLLIAE